MRRLMLAMMVVSAFCLADVTFGFQETGKSKDPKATAAKVPAVTARGGIESASVYDVRCEVSPAGEGGVLIRKIVPEGTRVKKGQVLVEFDAPGLKEQQTRQQVACNVSEAAVIQSQGEYESALIEKEAYVEGTFKLAKLEAESAVFLIKEIQSRAKRELEFIEQSTHLGATRVEKLEAAKFAVLKAGVELKLAETRLMVLEKYTLMKTSKQLEVQIKTAQARLRAEQHRHRLEREQLERISSQIANCTVKAPTAGRVIYAEPSRVRVLATDRRADDRPKLVQVPVKPVIRQGVSVRRGEPILSIRDPSKMRIKVSVPATKESSIKPGAPATIRVDAFPDLELKGTVKEIGKSSAGPTYYKKRLREITISIEDPPEGLRAGLTGEVRIQAGED